MRVDKWLMSSGELLFFLKKSKIEFKSLGEKKSKKQILRNSSRLQNLIRNSFYFGPSKNEKHMDLGANDHCTFL